jgi:hypothetical protein
MMKLAAYVNDTVGDRMRFYIVSDRVLPELGVCGHVEVLTLWSPLPIMRQTVY